MFNVPISTGDTTAIMNMLNANSLGGYTLSFNNQFNSTFSLEARETFERALNKWKCATQVNWTISPNNSTVRVASQDGINIISDDVLEPLPSNILGRGVNHVSGCGSGNNTKAVTTQLDIIINDVASSFACNFGSDAPSSSEIDFETVVLHELGHLHQLAHTRNTSSEVMAASLPAGFSKKNLTQNDIDGGLDVMARSSVSVGCGVTAHQAANQSITISTTSSFPVCTESEVIFTATATNVTGTPNLVWKRNGVVAGTGTTFTVSNAQINEVITCELQGCTTITSNSIIIFAIPTQHIGGPLCIA